MLGQRSRDVAAGAVDPVEEAVAAFPSLHHRRAEQISQILIVGSFIEAKLATVVEVHVEGGREALAEVLQTHAQLGVQNSLVFFLLRLRTQTLPRKAATEEVQQHIAEGLEVVSPTLLDAEMISYARIAWRAGETLVLAITRVEQRACEYRI